MAIDKKKLAAFGNRKDKAPQHPSKTPPPKGGKKPPEKDEDDVEDEHAEKDKDGGKHDDDHEEGDDEGEHKEPDGDEPDVMAIAEKVENGELEDDKITKMAMSLTDEDSEVPEWAHDEEKWDSSVDLVEPIWDELEHPWVVVAHVYDAMGGEIDGGDEAEKDPAEGGKGGKHKGPPAGQDGGGGA